MFRRTHKVFKFLVFFDRMIKNLLKFLRFFNRTSIRRTKSIQFPYVFWSDVQEVLKFLMFVTLTFPWPRSQLTIQAPNDFGLDLKVPFEQLLVRKRFIRVAENEVGPIGRWTRRPARLDFSPKIILATNEDRAIDLSSCVRCGCVGAGLGFPVGDSVFFPNLRSKT